MHLFLILLCSAVVRRCPNVFRYSSRLAGFNSRLGRRKFPIVAATGIRRQRLELLRYFRGPMAVLNGESMKFPFRREKPGILSAPVGTVQGR
jgi:hypothetical protein